MRSLTFQMTGWEWIKLLVRRIAAMVVFYSGVNALYRFLARRNQAVVLMYHRVIDPADLQCLYLQPGMYVTREAFEMQMEYLSRRYHVITLDECIQRMKRGDRFLRNTCVITFDDGWKDTYTHAYPILKKYDLPATVFLVSDYVGTDRSFWPERVSYLLMRLFEIGEVKEYGSTIYVALEKMGFFRLVSNPVLTPTQKIEAVIERMKGLMQADREKALYELEDLLKDHLEPGCSKSLILNWEEVAEMIRSNTAFGSHSKTHAILTKLSKDEARQEIVESKQAMESLLSKPCWAFSYPNGDYNDEIKRIIKDYYECAFTTQRGFVKHGADLFALERIGIHNDMTFTIPLFASRISGFLSILGL